MEDWLEAANKDRADHGLQNKVHLPINDFTYFNNYLYDSWRHSPKTTYSYYLLSPQENQG